MNNVPSSVHRGGWSSWQSRRRGPPWTPRARWIYWWTGWRGPTGTDAPPSLPPTHQRFLRRSVSLACARACTCELRVRASTRSHALDMRALNHWASVPHSLNHSLCPFPPHLQGNGGAAGLDGPKGGEVCVTVTVCVCVRAHLIGPHVCHMVRREARCVRACDWVQL